MSFHAAFDPFEALGLPRDASDHTIKTAYHSLARRYHPNRAQGTEQERTTLSQHFYQIHQAWKLLRTATRRRRQAELLDLLELHHEMLLHFAEFLKTDTPTQQHHEGNAVEDGEDGHISSDADEDDLPRLLQRRRTLLRSRSRTRSTTREQTPDDTADRSHNTGERAPRPQFRDVPTLNVEVPDDPPKVLPNYFTLRRKKLEKLKRAELQAFQEYRDAMIAKFDAEEEAENRQELYERAKWKREYFERAPREVRERLKTFRGFMGAYRILSALGHKDLHKENAAAFEASSPTVALADKNKFLRPTDNSMMVGRRKSSMRRGYSNDISGDQTSSDSDSASGSGPRRVSPPAPLASQNAMIRRGRATEAYASHSLINSRGTGSSLNGIHPTQGEFKLVVRRPTERGDLTMQDSGGETGSESSRSPSPHPLQQEKAFTLVPSTGAAMLFRPNPEARNRSLSPGGHRRTGSLPGTTPEVHLHTTDSCQFTTKTISSVENRAIPFKHVHLLSPQEKEWMLGNPPDTDANPRVVMHRLHKLNAKVADKYCIKSDMMAEFNFRLVYDRPYVPKSEQSTFIALSYRRKRTVKRCDGSFTLPLDEEIFQAFWEERQSANEGVWIDQISIDQQSNRERTVSMSAMDLVYRSARTIVVALDDIELAKREGDVLQAHMDDYRAMVYVAPRQRFRRKQPPWLESHEDLFHVIRKILKSSWFRRAWCRHEMRLAKNHIFLIPCKRLGVGAGRDILRFDGRCIAHLLALATEVACSAEVEEIKPALYAFFRDRARMLPGETRMRAHHGNFSTVVAEVFAMEAGGDPTVRDDQRASDAMKDKVSIILNTMECGLALQESLRAADRLFTENECFHDLLLVALAAQDPGALCSVGAPLPIKGFATSWMFQPTVVDSGLNNFKTLQRIPASAKFVTHTEGEEHYIKLDLKFLNRDLARHALLQHDPDRLALAKRFIEVCDKRNWGRHRKRYLFDDRRAKTLFGPDVRAVYAETLACVFACGPAWMSDVCQRYSMSGWRVDVHGAFELMVALQNTFGRWPEHAWAERAAGFLMDFVNFLVIRGLPLRQLAKREPWRPVWAEPRPGHPGKVLTFIPMNREICTAVPTVLAQPEYVHLARLWILQPRRDKETDEEVEGGGDEDSEVARDCEEWTLLGRSVVFSDEESVEHMHQIDGDFRTEQVVFGRRL